jgi:monofunctional biosynthetic peptidoglycan transglycosylase
LRGEHHQPADGEEPLPAARPTWTRKGFEAYFTLLIEGLWPKRRIMETYLNIAEWGPPLRCGSRGARQFRQARFRADQLQAARLATILPSPRRYRADDPGPFVIRQSRVIYERMDDVRRDRLDSCIFQ